MRDKKFFAITGIIIAGLSLLIPQVWEADLKRVDGLSDFNGSFSITEKQVRYNIPYHISNGIIDDMTLNCEDGSLLIQITAQNESDVKLTLDLPRSVLNPKINDKDDQFFVLRDGQEIEYGEIPHAKHREISMSFSADTKEIEIIHSFISELKPEMCEIVHDPPYSYVLPPLKQINSGIPFSEIQCKQNLVLIQKYDGSSACVTESTKQKLIERGWAKDNSALSKINTGCMTIEQSKQIASFFKTPTYLPEDYSYVCSRSGMPFESYIVYHNQEFPNNWQIPELINEGAIFIYQIDERGMGLDKKLQTYGSAEQRIQETYGDVMKNNPSLNPQLITINGMLAYAVDSCLDCGMQTANFTDRIIQESTSTKTRIKFIDDNGVSYMLETILPLQELIKVAESLQ